MSKVEAARDMVFSEASEWYWRAKGAGGNDVAELQTKTIAEVQKLLEEKGDE